MKKYLFALCIFSHFGLSAGSWLPAAVKINKSTSLGVNYDVNAVYDPGTSRALAVWGDLSSNRPFYAQYDGKNWWPGVPISTQFRMGVKYNVSVARDPASNNVVAAWTDYITLMPSFSTYTWLKWTPVGSIPVGSSTGGVLHDVSLAYASASGKMVAAWADHNKTPFYSLFDGTNWTAAAPISLGASDGVLCNVMLAYDDKLGKMVAAWVNAKGTSLFYSLFDGAGWSVAAQIQEGASGGGLQDICLAYNPSSQIVVAAWAGKSDRLPYFSQFDGSNWTSGAQVPQGASSGVYENVTVAYNPGSKSVFAAWGDASSHSPYFSIFNGTSWTAAGQIPPGATGGTKCNPSFAFDAYSAQLVVTWCDNPGHLDPYFSYYK